MGSMTIPDRSMPPLDAPERETLEGWLDYYRTTLLLICNGVGAEPLRSTPADPSALSLQGLVQHLAEVERNWFGRIVAGEDLPSVYPGGRTPEGHDGGFVVDPAASFATAVEKWEAEVASSRLFCADLELANTAAFRGTEVSLRWIFNHMIAEYARHCGHADILRERIDGTTGL